MKSDKERAKFKKQFKDEQWATLIADSKFKFAWDCNDIVKAGELVGGILFGTRQEWLRRKRRGEKERVREAEFQERLKEAERKMKFLMEGK